MFAVAGELAVVVGSLDLGESDRLARLLSPRIGRFSVMARQARSSRRRFAGIFEVGNEIVVDARGRGELPIVSLAELVRSPRVARQDFLRIALLCFGCEIAGGLAPENAAAERLHGLLCHWLARLELEPTPSTGLRVAFEAKALTFAGLCPRLTHCSRCGLALFDPVSWQPDAGGRHLACGPGVLVPFVLLHEIERVRRTPLAEVSQTIQTWLLTDAVEFHLGRALNSRSLLGTGSLAG